MKHVYLIICLTFVLSCKGQSGPLLIEQNLIENWSLYPVFDRLCITVDGVVTFRKEYKYLDSIHIYAITYRSDGLMIKGYLLKPKATGTHPCIIYNRGGNRDFGALNSGSAAVRLGPLAHEGYVVIASQYRGNAGSEGLEQFGGDDVNDVTILTEVLKEVEEADTDRIGIYGWSRGAMMSFMALAQSPEIKVAVVAGGVADMRMSVDNRPKLEEAVFSELIPNYSNNKEQELSKRSVVDWIDRLPKDVPILILHGTADWRVSPEQSLLLARALQEARIPYRLIMFEGGDHGISEHNEEVGHQVSRWFDRYLKQEESLPDMEPHGR